MKFFSDFDGENDDVQGLGLHEQTALVAARRLIRDKGSISADVIPGLTE